MTSCSKKPAKDPIYKPGEIFLLKAVYDRAYDRLVGRSAHAHYVLIMIMGSWRVKRNHYRILFQESFRPGDWRFREVFDLTEERLQRGYLNNQYFVKDNEDLTFLVSYGSPRQCLRETMSRPQFHRKINKKIEAAQKMLGKWQETNEQIGLWKKKLDEEDNGKSSDTQ